jgi:hypothetical protein
MEKKLEDAAYRKEEFHVERSVRKFARIKTKRNWVPDQVSFVRKRTKRNFSGMTPVVIGPIHLF